MAQNTRPHRGLKIGLAVATVLIAAVLGFAGNFLFDFALNPRAPYTMKMMQDGKDAKKGEQMVFCCIGKHARLRHLPAWIYQRAHRHGPIRQTIP